MKNQEKQIQESMLFLAKMDKEQLLEEMEQLLFSLSEKGADLEELKIFFSKGGLKQLNK